MLRPNVSAHAASSLGHERVSPRPHGTTLLLKINSATMRVLNDIQRVRHMRATCDARVEDGESPLRAKRDVLFLVKHLE
jgi:hypothetical protein